MKKFILLLIILSILIIRCSNESEKSQTNTETTEETIDEQSDYFSYEIEEETNTVKTEIKENKTNEIKTVNKVKVNETKESEVKPVYEKVDENLEEKTDNEITDENKIDNIEKIVYISKTGKKYHVENCRTLRAEKEAIDLNEAIEMGYEACKVCNPDNIVVNN